MDTLKKEKAVKSQSKNSKSNTAFAHCFMVTESLPGKNSVCTVIRTCSKIYACDVVEILSLARTMLQNVFSYF